MNAPLLRKSSRRLKTWRVPSTLIWFAGITIEAWPPEVYAEMLASWQPPAPVIQHELAAYRSGWLAQMEVRVPQAVEMQTYALFFWGFWRAGGLMLIGMALYKWGVVTAKRRPRFYATLAVLGLIIGLSATTFGAQQNLAHDWAIAFSRFGPG